MDAGITCVFDGVFLGESGWDWVTMFEHVFVDLFVGVFIDLFFPDYAVFGEVSPAEMPGFSCYIFRGELTFRADDRGWRWVEIGDIPEENIVGIGIICTICEMMNGGIE